MAIIVLVLSLRKQRLSHGVETQRILGRGAQLGRTHTRLSTNYPQDYPTGFAAEVSRAVIGIVS